MNSSGPLDSKIFVISNEKKESEDIPFTDYYGCYIKDVIRTLGHNPNTVRYEILSSETVENIKTSNPNILILLGLEPLLEFTGRSDISEWRGFVMWNDSLNVKMIATFSPKYCKRQLYQGKEGNAGQAQALLSNDIAKALKESEFKEYNIPKFDLMVNGSQIEIKEELTNLIETAKILSVDIETDRGNVITDIGFSSSFDRASSFIMSNIDLENFRLILKLLESNIPKVMQNAQFDMLKIRTCWKTEVNNLIHDTMCAAHCIYCELPKDLGTLMSLFTDLPYHKHMIKEDRSRYNALDALANLHIMRGELVDMEAMGILNFYKQQRNPIIEELISMQLEGNKVDLEARDAAVKSENKFQEDIIEVLNPLGRLIGREDYNPGSHTQNKILLYDVFKCKKSFKNGKESTDKESLNKILQKDNREFVKKIVGAIIKYNHSVHTTGVLNAPLINGRLHTMFNMSATVTGRWNSKKSILMTEVNNKLVNAGTNLQNLQEGIHRRIIIPG